MERFIPLLQYYLVVLLIRASGSRAGGRVWDVRGGVRQGRAVLHAAARDTAAARGSCQERGRHARARAALLPATAAGGPGHLALPGRSRVRQFLVDSVKVEPQSTKQNRVAMLTRPLKGC